MCITLSVVHAPHSHGSQRVSLRHEWMAPKTAPELGMGAEPSLPVAVAAPE
jgi:hypothetical protein